MIYEIYWSDLNKKAQKRLSKINPKNDFFPLAIFEIDNTEIEGEVISKKNIPPEYILDWKPIH